MIVFLVLGLLSGCREPSARESQDRTRETVPVIDLHPLAYPPISTFEQSCARCHGPQGSFYGEGFAEPDEAELTDVVREMMEGPAFLTPSDADVNAMVAYHRALAADEPFVCVTVYEPATAATSGRLEGEATPGAEVSLMAAPAAARTQAGSQGQWELTELREGATPVLGTRQEGKKTILNLTRAQWSHQAQ